MLDILNNRRKNGEDDDGKNKQLEVLLNKRELAEKVPAVAEQANPEKSAGNIEKNETMICHGTDTGNKWGKCPDNGNETGDDDGFASVFLEKMVCFDEV